MILLLISLIALVFSLIVIPLVLKLEGKGLLTNLINMRNLFQVAASADLRYGPIYNIFRIPD